MDRDLRSGVDRGMQIRRSMFFFARSVDPPKYLFKSENTTTLANRSVNGSKVNWMPLLISSKCKEGNMLVDYNTIQF